VDPGVTRDNHGSSQTLIQQLVGYPAGSEEGRSVAYNDEFTGSSPRWIDAFAVHDTTDRLSEIAVPTLVLAGGRDRTVAPELGRVVADGIPGARFEVLPEEGHRPFVEAAEEFNAG
jgi:pimeloyl-ACP methyl ester carboxylesterase